MAIPDARTRAKTHLTPAKVLTSSIPRRLLPHVFVANMLYVFLMHACKEWLLSLEISVMWVLLRVLACGGLGVLVWEGIRGQWSTSQNLKIEWSVLGISSLLLLLQQACLFIALYRLPAMKVILFAHFSSLWLQTLTLSATAKKIFALATAVLLSFTTDSGFSSSQVAIVMPAYAALVVHAATSEALEHTIGVLSPSLGHTLAVGASTLGASVLALPLYLFRMMLLGFPTSPALPLQGLIILPALAYSMLFLSPSLSRSIARTTPGPQYLIFSFPFVAIGATMVSVLFYRMPGFSDLAVASLLYYGMYPESFDAFAGPPRDPILRLLKSYIKTIVANPESRKIFYFLLLNLCYMGVQMLYGVWTNSLGLISDAIHMAFDCMAIGVGLFASVMATWPPNERFTYGYGRIETLSGFANGIFLILISIFIVFEAVQRILHPPEMRTGQLLLVSSLGLAVNLFGMFAMGGHHHHGGHSHSHGHSHSSHSPVPTTPHSHSHSDHLDHSHSHSHSSPASQHAHAHLHHGSDTHTASNSEKIQHSGHSHSHSIAEQHHSHSHSSHTRSQSIAVTSPSQIQAIHHNQNGSTHHKRHSRGQSIQITTTSASNDVSPIDSPVSHGSSNGLHNPISPMTPNYRFGDDEHFQTHHTTGHMANVHDHSHSHNHSHEGHSHNMRGVFLHVMADTLGSVGVIISTLLIQFYGWTGFDPIASLFIAILIAASVVPLVVDSGKVLCLDVDDKETMIQEALQELPTIEGLASFSSPRFWPKDASSLIGSIHVQLARSAASHDPAGPHSSVRTTYTKIDRVIDSVDKLLRGKIRGLEELTIQVEQS